MKTNKKELYYNCIDMINAKIEQHQNRMDEIKQSMENNDIKTDYDEDNKGQMLGDFEKHAGYLSEAQEQKEELSKIDPEHKNNIIGLGSVVETDRNYYFISVPLGEINMEDGSQIFAISTKAPIYKELEGKQPGDKFTINDEEHEIKGIE
ncbi:transcription elongation factor [Zunongwangia sp. HGR-M22]|uniref:transcription elongation factor n=1 Tax=Zunongwangia sp. HGR-M22 TaxID=3015168 RepID=UPI0022DE4360|nr:transcription elongation factor [Zunongwangia sp. HGR-M22]WBL24073.1 transcription elongation factor [Zunongwangia sp. HGR-M22]